MKMKKKQLILGVTILLLGVFCFAQASSPILTSAMQAYQSDSYEKAFSIISEGIPEKSTDGALKKQAADTLGSIGNQEYDIKNFKNAYEAFRKALKYDPTNTRSTQYFLKMRKEMDTTNLKNEAGPRVQSSAVASAPLAGTVGSGGTQVSPTISASSPAVSDVALTELKSALEQSDARLKSMESSVASADQQNAQLRAQAEQQMKLLQTFMTTQAAKSATTTAAAPKQSADEKALIAQTVELLAMMAERESQPTQIVVQSDPALQTLVETLTSQNTARSKQDTVNLTVLIILAVLGVAIIVFIIILVLSFLRARKKAGAGQSSRYEGDLQQLNQSQPVTYIGSTSSSSNTPLLEFIGSNSTAVGRPVDFDLHKDLLKADRLKRMYDEVRNGTLNWNTVREYIGELEISLKAEILKVVEQKINQGDLLSSEAILPILFPLVTDYDDFIREKSEKLASRAVAGEKSSTTLGVTDTSGETIGDPLDIRTLMQIPKELQLLFKTQEQSLVTAKISRGIGNSLGLSTDDCNLLYKSALAHDCGYLMLDRDVLVRTISKPEITEEDFAFIQSHVIKGLSFFGDIDLPEQFKAGILYHHERNDGSGYPDGLKKEAIPLFGKIIGVAETYAALVSKRAYRDKRDSQNALAIITDGARTKFDASIVEALVKVASSIGRE